MTSNRTNENKNKTKPKTTKKPATGNNVTKRSTAKGRTTGKSRKPEQKPEGIPMSNEITLVVSFGLVVLMMFSNFGHCGMIGKWLANFLFGIFGCAQFVLPVFFFLGITILVANDYSTLAMKKCGAGFVILMEVSAVSQLLYKDTTITVHDLFSLAINEHTTGGIIGGGIALLLKEGFGTAGSLVVLFCIFLLSCILLTQRSFVSFFRKVVKNIRTSKEEWEKSVKKRHLERLEREAATSEDMLINLEEPEDMSDTTEKAKSFLKMKNNRKKSSDKRRIKQCEEKVKELEEKSAKKEEKGKQEHNIKDIRVNVPLFTSSDEVKRKDCVRELHPRIYPFTEEDGKMEPFEGKLDFSAFKLPDEIKIEQEEEPCIPENKTEELQEETVVSEAQAIYEKDVPQAFDDTSPALPDVIETDVTARETNVPLAETNNIDINSKTDNINSKAEVFEKAVLDRKKTDGKDYIFPPVSLLVKTCGEQSAGQEQYLKDTAIKLQQTLASFGVNVTITEISCGPSVTRYEMFPEQGTKVSKILSLADDIKLNLAASDIRIEAPIPGKAAIGIEIPNKHNQTVHFRELVESHTFNAFKSKLAFAVGKDIAGKTVVTDLAKMPHLLIAGATGSGKSVCINTLIMSLLYKSSPEEVKLIMIDPKMVELSIYNGIPHLLIPVVTDPKKASGALNWAVAEMTNRYKKFTETGVRNIEGYNEKVKQLKESGEIDPESLKKMPQIVIIIDELADLMMVAPGEVEDAIVRLSQLARAAGIHLVIATQRPSVNVITGLIKANVPSRIAFSVSSGVDSRTIIDMNGAEKLLGKGDMLFFPSGY